MSELVDGSLSVFFGADDNNLRQVGDGGDNSGGEFNFSVSLIDLEDVVAGGVFLFNKLFHVVVDLVSTEVNLNKGVDLR